jgi:type VI protein secretion system component Hcp
VKKENMAHIHKRGEKWAYMVNVAKDPVTGKRRQITKSGFKIKKEAQLAAYKLEEAITNGGVIKETNITFENFAMSWIDIMVLK